MSYLLHESLSFLVPSPSTRQVTSLYWSYYREPNQQSVQDCSLPCPTSQFHLTAGSSVRRGRVARESLRVVCSIYFHPPRRLPQIWSTYGLRWIYLSREKQILSLSRIEFNKGIRLPGCFLPFHLVAILDELLHLGEERMGFVCIVANFFAQDKLHPLGWRCNCNFRHCFVNREFPLLHEGKNERNIDKISRVHVVQLLVWFKIAWNDVEWSPNILENNL